MTPLVIPPDATVPQKSGNSALDAMPLKDGDANDALVYVSKTVPRDMLAASGR